MYFDCDPDHAAEGAGLYISHCLFCNGVPAVDPGGNIPNLVYSDARLIDNIEQIVLTDARLAVGVPNYSDKLNKVQVDKIKAFIQGAAEAVAGASDVGAVDYNNELKIHYYTF